MTAGMHFAIVFRSKGKARHFFDRQAVDIGAERYGFAGLAAFETGYEARILFRIDFIGNLQLIQLGSNPLRRFYFLETQLRMAVELPPQRYDRILILPCQFLNLIHNNHPLRPHGRKLVPPASSDLAPSASLSSVGVTPLRLLLPPRI